MPRKVTISADDPPPAAEVGRWLGISRQRVSKLRESKVITGRTLEEQVRSYVAHLRDGRGTAQLTAERCELVKAQRMRIEREEKVALGKLLDADEAVAGWQGLVANCRQRLLCLPSAIAPALLGMEAIPAIEAAIRDRLYEAMAELADGK